MIIRIIIGIVAIVAIAVTVAVWQAGSLIKESAEAYGPEYLKVDVALEDVGLSIFSGEVGVKGFHLGQPEGFGEGDMVALNDFNMRLRPKTLLDDHIIIDTLRLEAPLLDVRVKDKTNNFQAFTDQVLALVGEAPADEPASEITLTIHKFEIVSPTVKIDAQGLVDIKKDITLESFTLTELGTDEQGLAPREILRHVMDVLQPQISKALIDVGLKDAVKNIAGKELDKLKSEAEEKIGSKLNDALGDDAGGAVKEKADSLVKGLFGKKKEDTTDGNN